MNKLFRTLILSSCLLIHYSLLAQNYQKLLTGDTISWVYWYSNNLPEFAVGDSMVAYPGDVDTIYKVYNYSINNGSTYVYYTGNLIESQKGDKLWFQNVGWWMPPLPPYDPYVIMDLNLKVGDTFPGRTWIVHSVYFDNFYGRKVIRVNKITYFWNEPYKFIEGIGPTISLDLVETGHLSCFYRQGTREYTTDNPYFDNCWCLITHVPDKKLRKD